MIGCAAVRLRGGSRDEARNVNKRPHSLVSISSSSSSSSSGFTSALLGIHQVAMPTPGVLHLGTLSTMHESPLELVSAALDQRGTIIVTIASHGSSSSQYYVILFVAPKMT